MPAPICITCGLEMRCEKNDQFVNDVTADQFPSTYWSGDLFRCPACRAEIVITNRKFEAISRTWTPRERDAWLRRYGNSDDGRLSITFAYSPEQREQYADQFETRSEPVDERG